MNAFVLLASLGFVAAGVFILVSGRDASAGWTAVLFFGGCAVVAAWDLLERRRRRPFTPLPPPDSAADGAVLVVRARRGEALVYFLGSAGFTAAGVFMILADERPFLGWAAVGLF